MRPARTVDSTKDPERVPLGVREVLWRRTWEWLLSPLPDEEADDAKPSVNSQRPEGGSGDEMREPNCTR